MNLPALVKECVANLDAAGQHPVGELFRFESPARFVGNEM